MRVFDDLVSVFSARQDYSHWGCTVSSILIALNIKATARKGKRRMQAENISRAVNAQKWHQQCNRPWRKQQEGERAAAAAAGIVGVISHLACRPAHDERAFCLPVRVWSAGRRRTYPDRDHRIAFFFGSYIPKNAPHVVLGCCVEEHVGIQRFVINLDDHQLIAPMGILYYDLSVMHASSSTGCKSTRGRYRSIPRCGGWRACYAFHTGIRQRLSAIESLYAPIMALAGLWLFLPTKNAEKWHKPAY